MPSPAKHVHVLRYAIIAGIGLLLALLLWWLVGPIPVQVALVERGTAIDAIYATGSVEPTVMLPIAPRLGGRLAQRMVDEGAIVRKGQVLAKMDDVDLASSVNEQQARANFARSQYARIAALAERGFVSTGEGDRARSELVAAEAALARMRAQRDYMDLTAPADGTIIRRDGEAGQFIAAGQQVFVLACCAPLRVTADIDEEDISRVHPGQAVLLKADAVPSQVFEGTVAEITPKGDPIARSYRVRITLADPALLQTGMTVDANVIVAKHEDALLLPNSAIHESAVWVVSGNRLQRRTVVTGIHAGKRTEVLRGVQAGEMVALQPNDVPRQGRRIRAIPP